MHDLGAVQDISHVFKRNWSECQAGTSSLLWFPVSSRTWEETGERRRPHNGTWSVSELERVYRPEPWALPGACHRQRHVMRIPLTGSNMWKPRGSSIYTGSSLVRHGTLAWRALRSCLHCSAQYWQRPFVSFSNESTDWLPRHPLLHGGKSLLIIMM